ncbi:hypothetical protein [Streptomyces cyslabdanicus]|uniref:hypothetical protein n=1 Tax=Streptomyces cyslabdanicus TaxID=1470456 RepID=UPI004044BCB1
MIQFLSGAGTALFSAVLTWCLTTATKRRTDTKADRAMVRAQADPLIVAVSEVRAMAGANKLLWGRWKETGRSLLLALVAGAGGAARTAAVAPRDDRGEWLAIAAGLGAVRALYDEPGGRRPGTRHIADALKRHELACSAGKPGSASRRGSRN